MTVPVASSVLTTAMREQVTRLAERAGATIMAVYARSDVHVTAKADASPLTEADEAAHAEIVAGLQIISPAIPIVSEEDRMLEPRAPLPPLCWVVDPLDGTKEFLKRTGEFTVNIALVEHDRPVFGVVVAPALQRTWWSESTTAMRRDATGELALRVSPPGSPLRLVASRDHAGPIVTRLLAAHPELDTVSIGSSLKFCLVAEGRADLYLRDGPTMVWDTAAGQAVLEAAGGGVFTLEGAPLTGAVPALRNPQFIAVGASDLPWRQLLAASS